jgi:hypothetical protein
MQESVRTRSKEKEEEKTAPLYMMQWVPTDNGGRSAT